MLIGNTAKALPWLFKAKIRNCRERETSHIGIEVPPRLLREGPGRRLWQQVQPRRRALSPVNAAWQKWLFEYKCSTRINKLYESVVYVITINVITVKTVAQVSKHYGVAPLATPRTAIVLRNLPDDKGQTLEAKEVAFFPIKSPQNQQEKTPSKLKTFPSLSNSFSSCKNRRKSPVF